MPLYGSLLLFLCVLGGTVASWVTKNNHYALAGILIWYTLSTGWEIDNLKKRVKRLEESK